MKVLITGANGQLGREVARQLRGQEAYRVISCNRDDLDITNIQQVMEVMTYHKVNVVINCAAYTAVDQAEEDVETAYKVNAIGAKNLAISCEKIGAKLIHISTDYVFDGKISSPRREDDQTNPQTVYGKSKLLGEEYIKTFSSKYFIVRTAWLYGDGPNFVRTMLKLAKTHEKINVVGDQYGSPTSAKELAKVIIKLMATEHYGTFHGVCQGSCSWFDFASKIFELMDINIKVNKVTSNEFVRPAPRPQYSVLDNLILRLYGMDSFKDWEEALEDYLNANKEDIWETLNL